jgi:hypothetical protein
MDQGMANKTSMNEKELILSVQTIKERVLLIRGEKVLLDSDLADLYGVETKVLVQAVKRNIERFPSDFMFQLTKQQYADLRSHYVTSSLHGGRRYPPYVFTEQGIAMLSSVLRSSQAVQVNIQIMRTFVKLRQLLNENKELAERLDKLEGKYDKQFKLVFDAIRELMIPPKPKKKRPIGFVWDERESYK